MAAKKKENALAKVGVAHEGEFVSAKGKKKPKKDSSAFDGARALAREVKETKTFAELDRTLAITLALLNVTIMSGVTWVTAKKPFTKDFKRRMRERVAHISEEQRIPAPPVIVAPLLTHYPFIAEEKELRDMFEKLLVSSMTKDVTVHPSFVEILKQLSSTDAALLKMLPDICLKYRSFDLPFLRVDYIKRPPGRGYNAGGYICDFDVAEGFDSVQISLNIVNLIRLGIVEMDFSARLPHEIYEHLQTSKEGQRHIARADKVNRDVKHTQGLLSLTEYGKGFLYACVEGAERLKVGDRTSNAVSRAKAQRAGVDR